MKTVLLFIHTSPGHTGETEGTPRDAEILHPGNPDGEFCIKMTSEQSKIFEIFCKIIQNLIFQKYCDALYTFDFFLCQIQQTDPELPIIWNSFIDCFNSLKPKGVMHPLTVDSPGQTFAPTFVHQFFQNF